ncbi:acyl-CoA dehydrogenase family protein [Actinomadura flavalba]|uniref:acyl-CoA dehydrogenase family protein n=1 Tax=Actinomadura flavalba TaxID=1120938 RepID=UPI00035DAF05|nr:acyl-CoA dehydrogenase family protein [Actinomadura flavalba]
MDFRFTDDQRAVADKVRAFVADEVTPHADRHDADGRFPPEFFSALSGAGLFALSVPAEYGGAGHDAVTVGVALEELARGEAAACHPVLNAALIGSIIAANGDDDQRAAWLPKIASGEAVVALCLTEPERGTDAARIGLAARPDGGGWRLEGTKTSIMIGGYATHGLVFARTGDDGARGITAFFTELPDSHVKRTVLDDLGHRAGRRATLEFDALPVGPENVVGGLGEGFVGVMRGFDYSRALMALEAIGSASAGVDAALEYARERTAFGAAIGTYQGVAFPLVEHVTKLRAARLLAYEALWRKDQGLDHRAEANMAKNWAPRVAVEALHQALLTFGHYGWSTDNPVTRRLRDGVGLEIADGTANATALVVARTLLGREAAP